MGRFVNLIGKKFVRLTVLSKLEKRDEKESILWKCECECGEVVFVKTASLNNGNTKSCGCLQRDKVVETNAKKKVDMEGKKIGRLTVIKEAGKTNSGNYIWLCQCECGNMRKVSQGDLHSRDNHSCGCLTKESVAEVGMKYGGRNFNDLSGQNFGWLRIIERIEDSKKYPKYRCLCLACGNKKVAYGKLLLNGHIKSCGCIKSVGESELRIHLERLGVKFTQQYRIDGCKRTLRLPFDFAIFNKEGALSFLIEFDGIQHHIKQKHFTDERFKYIQENDSIKTEFCFNNNIPLLRIPYYESNKKEEKVTEWIRKYI